MGKSLAFDVDSITKVGSLSAGTTVSFSDLSFDASEDKSHPNKMPFEGTLLLLDQPSDQPPHGAEGHCIEVPKNVAEKRLRDLVGMGVNYETDLEGHAPRRKVGVITSAFISGNKVKVKGTIWKKDFPESQQDLHGNRQLGMSMELGDVFVRERNEPVWKLVDFRFTGATILKKDSAAYWKTSLAASGERISQEALQAASAALGVNLKEGGNTMNEKDKNKDARTQGQLLTSAISAAVGPAVEKGLSAGFEKLTAVLAAAQDTNSKMVKAFEDLTSAVIESNASILAAVESLTTGEVAAMKDDDATADPTADATMDSAADATTDATQDATADATMDSAADPTIDSTDDKPGNINPDAESNAKKQARSGAAGQLKAARERLRNKVTSISAAAEIKSLRAEAANAKKELSKLKAEVGEINAANENLAKRIERKSLSPELSTLLAKNGISTADLFAGAANGQKLAVADVDAAILRCNLNLTPTDRIKLKNELLAAGTMDEGIVVRNHA